jgi:hypothetical protein
MKRRVLPLKVAERAFPAMRKWPSEQSVCRGSRISGDCTPTSSDKHSAHRSPLLIVTAARYSLSPVILHSTYSLIAKRQKPVPSSLCVVSNYFAGSTERFDSFVDAREVYRIRYRTITLMGAVSFAGDMERLSIQT